VSYGSVRGNLLKNYSPGGSKKQNLAKERKKGEGTSPVKLKKIEEVRPKDGNVLGASPRRAKKEKEACQCFRQLLESTGVLGERGMQGRKSAWTGKSKFVRGKLGTKRSRCQLDPFTPGFGTVI